MRRSKKGYHDVLITQLPVSPRIGSGGPIGISLQRLLTILLPAADTVAPRIPATKAPLLLDATIVASIESTHGIGGRQIPMVGVEGSTACGISHHLLL